MKLIIDSTALNTGLSAAGSAINPNDSIPLLTCVLIRCDERIMFRGTNMVIDIERFVAAESPECGRICVNHARLAAWAANLPKEAMVELVAADNAVQCRSGRARLRLPTLDPRDYPPERRVENAAQFMMAAEELMARLLAAVDCVAPEKHPSECLKGVHIQAVDRSKFRIEASDLKICIRFDDALPSGANDMPEQGIVLPPRTIQALKSILPQDGDITLQISSTFFCAEAEGNSIRIVSKLIGDQFMDISRAMPKEPEITASFDTAEAASALRRVLSTRGQEASSKRVLLTVTGDEMRMEVGALGDIIGDAEDGIKCSSTEDFSIAFYGPQFIQQLEALGCETADLCVCREPAPYLLKPSPDNGSMSVGGAMR
jgi:DNA polymerase III sliding clamp (beta) subunit (PCNA family)